MSLICEPDRIADSLLPSPFLLYTQTSGSREFYSHPDYARSGSGVLKTTDQWLCNTAKLSDPGADWTGLYTWSVVAPVPNTEAELVTHNLQWVIIQDCISTVYLHASAEQVHCYQVCQMAPLNKWMRFSCLCSRLFTIRIKTVNWCMVKADRLATWTRTPHNWKWSKPKGLWPYMGNPLFF